MPSFDDFSIAIDFGNQSLKWRDVSTHVFSIANLKNLNKDKVFFKKWTKSKEIPCDWVIV